MLSAFHRFIIRNNGLLPAADIAAYLGVSADAVKSWIERLGLPEMEVVHRERAFPLVLRRNHDLLSEEQIARLLGIPVDVCHKTTQEMDFLDIKLGARPEELPRIEPNAPGLEAEAERFRACCGHYLDDYREWDRPFGFLEELGRVEERFDSPAASGESSLKTRIMHSYTGSHGDFLLTGEDFYSEGILSRLRNRGINAGWMPALLRDLAPSKVFPELGEGHEVRIDNLRKQAQKAARYGVRIFLYLNEPRFMPESFFANYPDSKGMPWVKPGYFGLCTSDSRVRDWLREAAESVFRAVPELGGVLLITASENRTNCYSHAVRPADAVNDALDLTEAPGVCPRCAARGVAPVLADTANILSEAARSVGSQAEVVQWLWGWEVNMPAAEVKHAIAHLSPDVTVMVDWAKHTRFSLFGREATIGEYTLAYVKPSDFAREIIETARTQGRRTMAKCALVTTVEMNALPYLPALTNVETLLKELRASGVDGFFGCWIFGAYPGRNMELAAFAHEEHPARSLALKYYDDGAEDALAAWRLFSEGMRYYPTTVPVLYCSAVNPGPGIRFSLTPEPWRHGMVAMASERLDEISEPFGPEIMSKGFRKAAECFAEGLKRLDAAITRSANPLYREENRRDYAISEACMRHMLSAANYTDFILARNWWLDKPRDGELRSSLIELMKDEMANAEAMLALAKRDSRIGYEGSIGYFYTPIEIIEKIYQLKAGVDTLAGVSG